jgi:predicted nucleotidyltransferase
MRQPPCAKYRGSYPGTIIRNSYDFFNIIWANIIFKIQAKIFFVSTGSEIFGSLARGKEKAESDIDIIVELDEQTFDHYMELKFRLEEVLQRPVGLGKITTPQSGAIFSYSLFSAGNI